jgi:hypothetical protein
MTEDHTGFWCAHLTERHHLEDLGVDGKIILNVMKGHELD